MLIMTYAMCGFANPGSLGIMIGGLGHHGPGPAQRDRLSGFRRSVVAGTLATCMTGAVVGILSPLTGSAQLVFILKNPEAPV
jgi:CNT family concentrative nucleoside transporter